MDMKTILRTNVGSHMWNMNHKDSDIDIFEIYIGETKDILLQKEQRSYSNKDKDGNDVSGHEIGKVVKMLLSGNVNFIWGIYSPIIIDAEEPYFNCLAHVGNKNKSKKAYYSINGMAYHNIKHLKEEGLTEKKTRTILRTIDFGIEYLNGNGYVFRKNDEELPNDYRSTIYHIECKLNELKEARDSSPLPDEPENIQLAEDWLVALRMAEMEGSGW